MLTQKQILDKFEAAVAKFEELYRTQLEANHFGTLRQGVVAIARHDLREAARIPFMFYDNQTLTEVKRNMIGLETDEFHVAFATEYIHFPDPNCLVPHV